MTAGGVTSFEIMSREGIDIVNRHSGTTRDPLSTKSPYCVLIELSSQRAEGLREAMEQILEAGLDKGLVLDATIAESVEQAKAFWRIRELFGEMQGREGGSIKHDVSVPVANIPAFIEEGNAAAVKLIPGCRPLPFGHVGDGNIHYNISQPVGADKAEFLKRWDDMNDVIYRIVLRYGGSVSAEHGVGIVKRDYLPKIKDPVAYDLMKTLKRTLDPKGILNPGKVLP
jgi:FAD/FMN-containing dehydrogenase